MKTQRGFSTTIVAIVIALVVGGVVYWANVRNKEPFSPQPPSVQTPPPASASETTNWQTYRNEEYGFEFRYPPSAEIYTVKFKQSFLISLNFDPKAAIALNTPEIFNVAVSPIGAEDGLAKETTIEQYRDRLVKSCKKVNEDYVKNGLPSLDCEEQAAGEFITGDGTKGIPKFGPYTAFVFFKDNFHYAISGQLIEPEEQKINNDFVLKVAKTFRFTR